MSIKQFGLAQQNWRFKMQRLITNEDKEKFAVSSKIGLISSVSPEGYPHVAFISTIQAKAEDEIIFGEFINGRSKKYLDTNPKAGFCIVNTAMEWWTGKAVQTDIKDTGPEFDLLNDAPLFRYNTYFGIGKVHYLKLHEFSGKKKLAMGRIIRGALLGRLIKPLVPRSIDKTEKIKGITAKLLKKIDCLKFISYVDDDGFPVILPIIQALQKDTGKIIIPLTANKEQLKKIKAGSQVAIYIANLELSTVLLQGTYRGIQNRLGLKYGVFDVEMVYNSMPPITGYVYPEAELKLVH